jgi:catechol 2,3-dioxygenase-like lactoylglutathione lyase family enzyme
MQFKGIHHVSINVRDVEEARIFYVDKLGLEILVRPDLGFDGYWLKAGEQEIHLIGIDSGKPVKEQHFALYVDNVDETISSLNELEIKVSKPNVTPGICRAVFVRNPSENMIEFNERWV